jgi:hypothetical protein
MVSNCVQGNNVSGTNISRNLLDSMYEYRILKNYYFREVS